MAKSLSFYGSSDDFLMIHTSGGCRKVEYQGKPLTLMVASSEGQLYVVAFAPADINTCWSIGLLPADEGIQIPLWPMTWKLAKNGCSAELTLIVPDDTSVLVMTGKGFTTVISGSTRE